MTVTDPRAARLQRAQELQDHAMERMAHDALNTAERTLKRHRNDLKPVTRYAYATARDTAAIARRRFEYLGNDELAARAHEVYIELERLASLERQRHL